MRAAKRRPRPASTSSVERSTAKPRIRFALCPLIVLAQMSSVAAAAVPGRSARLLAEATVWPKSSVVALGQVRSGVAPIESAGNILAVYVDRSEAFTVRVNLVAPVGILDGARHFARLDGRDKRGVRLAPGLYFVRLCHGSERRIQRLVIMP